MRVSYSGDSEVRMVYTLLVGYKPLLLDTGTPISMSPNHFKSTEASDSLRFPGVNETRKNVTNKLYDIRDQKSEYRILLPANQQLLERRGCIVLIEDITPQQTSFQLMNNTTKYAGIRHLHTRTCV